MINAADAKQGACFEWATSDYKKRVDDGKGLVASANNFTDPTWPTMTYVPEGGPTFPEESSLKTYYSIVAVPKDLKLWLNIHGLQDWTEIDLKPFFK